MAKATASKQGNSSTAATRNARRRGQAPTTTATPRKAKASGAAKPQAKGKGKAPAKGKAKATPKATPNPAPTTRRKPGTHGLAPVATGKLPKATVAKLLAVPKAGKGNSGKGLPAPGTGLGLVYRSMRCQASGGPVATVHSSGKGKLPAGWLAVCLVTGAYGVYASRHAAATAMAWPAYHGGAGAGA